MSVKCEWDADKAKTNLRKHKVGFDEAEPYFADAHAKIFNDDGHSAEENREDIRRSLHLKSTLFWSASQNEDKTSATLLSIISGPGRHRERT